jgi:hypothetical protein
MVGCVGMPGQPITRRDRAGRGGRGGWVNDLTLSLETFWHLAAHISFLPAPAQISFSPAPSPPHTPFHFVHCVECQMAAAAPNANTLCGEQGNAAVHFAVGGRDVGKGDLTALKAIIAAKCDLEVINVSACIALLCTPSTLSPLDWLYQRAQDKKLLCMGWVCWIKVLKLGRPSLCLESVLGRDSPGGSEGLTDLPLIQTHKNLRRLPLCIGLPFADVLAPAGEPVRSTL